MNIYFVLLLPPEIMSEEKINFSEEEYIESPVRRYSRKLEHFTPLSPALRFPDYSLRDEERIYQALTEEAEITEEKNENSFGFVYDVLADLIDAVVNK